MRDPYKKKLRDLRRKLRSVQRPYGWKLFAQYFPEWSDRNPHNGQIDWVKWRLPGFHEESRNRKQAWYLRICGYDPSWQGSPPAWFRRDRNRQLRTRQKAAVSKAFRDGSWDDFILPRNRHDIGWLWW
ncbi:MAG: hypothetical protein ACXAC5_00710 [Promethearchaeota archaeon]|jgi:hypothetical protein